MPRMRHDKLALAISSIANDRSHLVGKIRGNSGEVAGPIVTGARTQSRIAT